MSVKLTQNASIFTEQSLSTEKHILVILGESESENLVFNNLLQAKLSRTKTDFKELEKSPLLLDLPNGAVASFILLKDELNTFQRHALLLKAIKPLLDEQPAQLAIALYGNNDARNTNACAAYYVATVNSVDLPNYKKDKKPNALRVINIYGH